MADLKRRLDAENQQRLKLEDGQLKRDSEINFLQDRLTKTDREFNKIVGDFDAIDSEVRLLRSRENKTIVEHVHVLEAAKRLTDRQLADAKLELQSLRVHVKTLEKFKARDAEELSRHGERERAATRSRESDIKAAEERARLKLLKELQVGNENLQSGISNQARSLSIASSSSDGSGVGGGRNNGMTMMGGSMSRSGTGGAERELAEARRQISDFGLERRKLEAEVASLRRSDSKGSMNGEFAFPLLQS